jgi:hypothetical protein
MFADCGGLCGQLFLYYFPRSIKLPLCLSTTQFRIDFLFGKNSHSLSDKELATTFWCVHLADGVWFSLRFRNTGVLPNLLNNQFSLTVQKPQYEIDLYIYQMNFLIRH